MKAFIAGRQIPVEQLATELGVSRSGLYLKLNGQSPWSAAEVATLAELFGITVSDLYSGLGGTFAGATGTWREQQGTWADRADPGTADGPVSSGWRTPRRLRLVEPATLSALPVAS